MRSIPPNGCGGEPIPHPDVQAGPDRAYPEPTLSLAKLAEWRGFSTDYLAGLGVHDLPGQGVGIDYRDEAGNWLFTRLRKSLVHKPRFLQPKGARLAPYGLWRLAEWRPRDAIILCEGESDCWALWSIDEAALGLPGAGAAGCLQPEHLAGFETVFVVREPGESGDTFVPTVMAHLQRLGWRGHLRELPMPEGVKDPADLRQRNTAAAFRDALRDAADRSQQLMPVAIGERPFVGRAAGEGRNGRTTDPPPQLMLLPLKEPEGTCEVCGEPLKAHPGLAGCEWPGPGPTGLPAELPPHGRNGKTKSRRRSPSGEELGNDQGDAEQESYNLAGQGSTEQPGKPTSARRRRSKAEDGSDGSTRLHGQKKLSGAVRLRDFLLGQQVEYFQDTEGVAYARFPFLGHREVWPIDSRRFRDWAIMRWEEVEKKVASSNSLNEAIKLLEARTRHLGPKRTVNVRVAAQGGRLYLNLADDAWRVIEIDQSGWRLCGKDGPDRIGHNVYFRRPSGALPLPLPTEPCRLDVLKDYVNFADEDSFRLILAWMLFAFQPRPNFPIVVITGSPDSGKTFSARAIVGLVDPADVPLSRPATNEWDLWASASGVWVYALNNLSDVESWASDALCCLAEGGGMRKRAHYENTEMCRIQIARPVLLTSIEDVATRADFLSRGIPLDLKPIAEEDRIEEGRFWDAYERDRPKLLAALLNALVGVLRELPHVGQLGAGRLGEYARYGVALERSQGWPEGSFLAAYNSSRGVAAGIAAEANVLTEPLRELLEQNGGEWDGQAQVLLDALDAMRPEGQDPPRGWPRRSWHLSNRLRSALPALRMVGIEISFGTRTKHQRASISLKLRS